MGRKVELDKIQRDIVELLTAIIDIPDPLFNQALESKENALIYSLLLAIAREVDANLATEPKEFAQFLEKLDQYITNTLKHTKKLPTAKDGSSELNEVQIGHLRDHRQNALTAAETFAMQVSMSYGELGANLSSQLAAARNASRDRRSLFDLIAEQAKDAIKRADEAETLFNSAVSRFEEYEERAKAIAVRLEDKVRRNEVGALGENYRRWSKNIAMVKWLVYFTGIIASIVAIGVFLWESFHWTAPEGMNSEDFAWSLIVMRAGAVAIGVALIAFFARQFSAASHAENAAKHRAIAASTYKELRTSYPLGNLEDAVLLTILNSLFSEPPSPYVRDQGGENENEISRLRALLEQATPRKSG